MHTKLGKPIPSDSPTVVTAAGAVSASAVSNTTTVKPVPITSSSSEPIVTATVVKPNPPKINFIGPKTDTQFGTQPAAPVAPVAAPVAATVSTHDFTAPVPGVITTPATLTVPASTTAVNIPVAQSMGEGEKDTIQSQGYTEKEIQPVGQDYIEEVRSEDGEILH